MEDVKVTYGLMIHRVTRHQIERLEVRAMKREDGQDWPLNIGHWYSLDKKPYLCDLVMVGQLYEGKSEFYVDKPEFKDCFSVGLVQATGMVKTLTTIANRFKKDEAYEPGDIFMSLAGAIDAKWVCVPQRGRTERSSYNENAWTWYSIADGRNAYRGMIRKMVAEEQARLDDIAKAKAA